MNGLEKFLLLVVAPTVLLLSLLEALVLSRRGDYDWRAFGVSLFDFVLRLVLTALTLNLLYQFWIHATWIPKLGWLEGWLNTPSAHRVHHASNLLYLDHNYGGVLVVFDRLFGTYQAERDDEPCRYGWVHPITSHNPLKIEFAQWIALARDLASARSMRAFVGCLVMPPGWRPDGPGETTQDLRARQGCRGRRR